jgi:hypothetical protein
LFRREKTEKIIINTTLNLSIWATFAGITVAAANTADNNA